MAVLTIGSDWLTIGGQALTIGGDERMSNILIDFGVGTERTTGNWNNVDDVAADKQLLASMIDSNGNPVAVTLDSENAYTGGAVDRGAAAVGDYPLTATTDVFEVNSTNKRRSVFTWDAAFIGEAVTLRFYAAGILSSSLGSSISLTDGLSVGGNFIVGTSTGVTDGDLEDIPYDPVGVGQGPLDFEFVIPPTGIVNLQVGNAAGGTGTAGLGVVEFIFPELAPGVPALTTPYTTVVLDKSATGSIALSTNWTNASTFNITNMPNWMTQVGDTGVVNYADTSWGGQYSENSIGGGNWFMEIEAIDASGLLSASTGIWVYIRP
jgi:hypothetical protein